MIFPIGAQDLRLVHVRIFYPVSGSHSDAISSRTFQDINTLFDGSFFGPWSSSERLSGKPKGETGRDHLEGGLVGLALGRGAEAL